MQWMDRSNEPEVGFLHLPVCHLYYPGSQQEIQLVTHFEKLVLHIAKS